MSKQAARNIQPPQPPQLPPQAQQVNPLTVIAELKGIIGGLAEEIAILRAEINRLKGEKQNG